MNPNTQTEKAMGTRARRQGSSDRARSADDGGIPLILQNAGPKNVLDLNP
jgi:hypothetical protein